MSGIGAIVWSESSAPNNHSAERMQDALRVYGPDRQAVRRCWPCELVSTLALGFTPEDEFERQPVAVGGRWHIVFAGWISNRSDIFRMLGLDSKTQAKISDSALFARLWQMRMAQAIKKLDGSFACLIWDELDRIFYAIRSIGSAPPLHYHHNSKRTAFSTVPKGLFAMGDVDRHLDEVKLSQNLLLDFDDRHRSYFDKIARLPTGHMLVLRQGQISISSLYELSEVPDIRYQTDSAYIEAAKEQFDRAVSEHARSRETPAIALSSGLDSTAVAITALERLAPEPLISFTSVPEPGWDGRTIGYGYTGDERGPVEALARFYPALETNFIDCAGMDATAFLDEFFLLAELPPRNVTNLGWFTSIAKATRMRSKRVLLTGDSGNMTLGFERQRSIAGLLRDGRAKEAANKAVRKLRQGLSQSSRLHPRDWSAAKTDWQAVSYTLDRLNSPRDLAAEALFGGERDEGGDLILALQTLTGVQVRDPLGDRRLAEFCMGLPPAQFDKDGVTRCVIKRVMGDRLPAAIATAPRGRQAADTHLRLTRRIQLLRQEIEAGKSHASLSRLVDFDRLSQLLTHWPDKTPLSRADHPDFLLVHLGLPRALANIRFAKWSEGANR
ncbi:MAG: asparagine synthetase B family protein [Pseudomonadota bacterium]